jgi:hypothetical protein
VTLARPISAIKVPATVQALLASRIDRLSAPEKAFLQTLAVLARISHRLINRRGDWGLATTRGRFSKGDA